MTRAKRSGPSTGSVTWSVLGLLTVPLLSVWAAAILGEASSSTDQSRLGWGLVALLAGVGSGLVAVWMARTLFSRAVSVVATIVVRHTSGLAWYAPTAIVGSSVSPATVPVRASHPASIRRRGPPVDLG